MKDYIIYELLYVSHGDNRRLVEKFDNMKDAKTVLKALELVNILFTRYKIVIE
jgi:hypothetical protein